MYKWRKTHFCCLVRRVTVLGGMVHIVVEIVDERLAVEVVAGIAAEVSDLSYVPWLQDWMWNYILYSNVQVFDNSEIILRQFCAERVRQSLNP